MYTNWFENIEIYLMIFYFIPFNVPEARVDPQDTENSSAFGELIIYLEKKTFKIL